MLELAARILARLDALAAAGGPARLVVATAVAVEGSSPRTVGTSMTWDGEQVIGSIAGGCVEGAVVEAAQGVLDDGVVRLLDFGVSDEAAWSVGLACGGRLRIHLAVLSADAAGLESAEASVASGAAALAALRRAAAAEPAALALTATGFDARTGGDAGVCDDPDAFVDRVAAPARTVVIGAMEFSIALVAAARALGDRVLVVDPRELFLTPERFPGAERTVEWPPEVLAGLDLGPADAVCLLSHDERFDAETLLVALRSGAGYVGAMGSRRTDGVRRARLRELGATEEELGRLCSPIGLDLGASTPEETAVAILAEVVRARRGGSGEPLRERSGPVHASRTADVAPNSGDSTLSDLDRARTELSA
ncbi:MAG: XdhC family protein [Actinomycetales bacterium]|nr:XdhC family protein [Actinomycetales bacterium]